MKWYSKCHFKWCYLALAEYCSPQNALNPTSAIGLSNKERLANAKRQVLKEELNQESHLLTQSGVLEADWGRNCIEFRVVARSLQHFSGHRWDISHPSSSPGWMKPRCGAAPRPPTGSRGWGALTHWALGNFPQCPRWLTALEERLLLPQEGRSRFERNQFLSSLWSREGVRQWFLRCWMRREQDKP